MTGEYKRLWAAADNWQKAHGGSNLTGLTADSIVLLDAYKEAVEALSDIAQGKGRYSRDPLTHCENAVEDMKATAHAALARARENGVIS